jgi:hypothetical protein
VSRSPVRVGTLPVAQLPSLALAFADLPYSPITQASFFYHLRTYERWCGERGEQAWPPTLERLLCYGADRAETKAYFTVREHLRIVSLVARKESGVDLFANPKVQELLQGVKRLRPPAPVLPLRPSQIERLFSYKPRTESQRRTRGMCLLTYGAGFRIREHARLRCEMVTIDEQGAVIRGLSESRLDLFIGRAKDPQRCPVRALEELIAGRVRGPVFRGSRCRAADGQLAYFSAAQEIERFGRAAGVTPLSFERLRLAGMLEQVRHIDAVRLAHFHGYRDPEHLASVLDRHVPVAGYVRRRRHR